MHGFPQTALGLLSQWVAFNSPEVSDGVIIGHGGLTELTPGTIVKHGWSCWSHWSGNIALELSLSCPQAICVQWHGTLSQPQGNGVHHL